MKCVYLLIAFLFACAMAQDYTMGTREQPKADLSPDEKLIIQNTVGFRMSHDNVVYP